MLPPLPVQFPEPIRVHLEQCDLTKDLVYAGKTVSCPYCCLTWSLRYHMPTRTYSWYLQARV
jgi:hypothetical protein